MPKKIVFIIILGTFLASGVAYPEESNRSLFKNKRPNYEKLQQEKQAELERSRDVLSGKKTAPSDNSGGQYDSRTVKVTSKKDISNIYIPEEIGRVTEVYEAPISGQQGPRRFIVHIQDLHTNPEGSFNLAKILDILIKDYGLGLVCSEGAEGEVDTSSVSGFPDTEVREKTAKLFVESGELTGEEYLSITKYPELQIWGMEDKDLYFKNIEEFNKIMEYNQASANFTRQVKEALDRLKREIYSKELLGIDEKEAEYGQGKLDTPEFLDYLAGLSKDLDTSGYKNITLFKETLEYEKGIKQDLVRQESQGLLAEIETVLKEKDNNYEREKLLNKSGLFKEQKISAFSFYSYLEELARRHLKEKISEYPDLWAFLEYLRKVNSIDSMAIFSEVENLAYDVKDRVAANDNQKNLTKAIKHVKLLETLFNLKMSNEELGYYLANKEDFKVGFFKSFLEENLRRHNIEAFVDFNPDLIDIHLDQLEHFYEIAHKRDIVMANNAISEIEKRDVKVAALISGGFHSGGMTKILKEKGYSYAVIAPFSKTTIDEENYRYLLSGKRKPIEDLIGQMNESAK